MRVPALDVSGSAKPLYDRGIIQETVDRLLAVSMRFDDNGEMDMWCFDDGFARLETASAADYGTYVKNHILRGGHHLWGGTAYAPVLTDVRNFYFPRPGMASAPKKSGGFLGGLFGGKKEAPPPAPVNPNAKPLPALCLFITDGANADRPATERLLRESQGQPVYWMMVGVGPSHHFGFIEEMADALPNVGFLNLSSLDISDDALYEQLITDEFCDWVKQVA